MLAIHDLAHRYAGAARPALEGVSLQAARGSILGLLGPNGAGKSTLIAHLTGSLPVTQGRIEIDGQPLSAVRRAHPTRIAVAPQDFAFYPLLTVRENLACFAGVAGLRGALRDERIEACLAFARLEEFAGTRAQALSGGLKRRLNFALALLAEPQLLLFDEPTVGVDPQTRAFLLDAVRQLARQGTAVVYTSHYMEEIEAVADRVVILDHGRVLREGSLVALLAEGAHRLQLRCEGLDVAVLCDLLTPFGEATLSHGEWTLALHREAQPGAAMLALESAGVRVLRASYGHRNLEQLFMQLTHRSLRDD